MDHSGLKFLERRIRLRARLDDYEPPVLGPVEARRLSRNSREAAVETTKSTSSAGVSVAKGVSFDEQQSVTPDTSPMSMPELAHADNENDH